MTIPRFHALLQGLIRALPASSLGPEASAQGLDALLGYAHLQGLLPGSPHTESFVAAHKTRLAVDLALRVPLDRLGQAFAEVDISALLLKGEAWSRSVYPVAGVRGRCDCDIWVPRSERDRAIAVLESLGIREVRPYACAGEVLTPEALFRGMGLNVDLHWQLSTLSPICNGLDFEHCWQSAVPVPGLSHWRMLGPTEALLHAALHLACPGPAGPRWIWGLDGLLLLDWAATDPEQLRERAIEAKIGDLWQSFIDYAQLLTRDPATSTSSGPRHRTGTELYLLLTRAPWRDRLRLMHEIFWPRAAFLQDRYPDSGAPLWWLQLRRWLESLKKIARRA